MNKSFYLVGDRYKVKYLTMVFSVPTNQIKVLLMVFAIVFDISRAESDTSFEKSENSGKFI